MSIIDEVMALIPQVVWAPDDPPPAGTTEEALAALSQRLSLCLPPEVRAWLLRCNCARIGPGGMIGTCPDNSFLDLEAHYALYPLWQVKGWIPLAGDGLGNYYVLDTTSRTRAGHPVLFLDHEQSSVDVCDTPAYVAASNLWSFLRYILLAELDDAYDLFDEQEAVREDPGLVDDVGVPRPWEA